MAKRKRTLFCGGRTYSDYEAVKRVIGMVNPTSVIHGAAAGADSLAGRYAKENEVPCRAYPPSRRLDGGGRDWKFRRNERMLLTAKPDLVVAFPGGPGTDHMVRTSKKHGYPVWDLRKDDRPGELPEWAARLLGEEEEGAEAQPVKTPGDDARRQAGAPAAQPAQPAQQTFLPEEPERVKLPERMGKTVIETVSQKSLLMRGQGFIATYDWVINPYTGCSFGCNCAPRNAA